MNTSYLLSVLDLYLAKEQNGNMIIEIEDVGNFIKFNFSYTFDHTNRTSIKVDKTEFMGRIEEFISKIQNNLEISKENLVNFNNQSVYTVDLETGRKISFTNFSDDNINLIRGNFKNLPAQVLEKTPINVPALVNLVIDIDEEEESYEEILEKNIKRRPAFSFGFTSFATLFVTAIWFLDIFMIALWIFKALGK